MSEIDAAEQPHIARIVVGADHTGPTTPGAFRKAWAAAVIRDPFVTRPATDLAPLVALGESLGEVLGRHALELVRRNGDEPLSYGKGAIVGAASDIEHAAAILHPRLGRPLRAMINQGRAIIPSTVKYGGPGAHLDVPLHEADDEWNFAALDSVEVCVPGAPRHDEIVVVVALAAGGRAFARIGRS